MSRRIEIRKGDVLVYDDVELDQSILEAIVGTEQRVLWAFVRNDSGDVMAVPYNEERVIWLSESDLQTENDVEV